MVATWDACRVVPHRQVDGRLAVKNMHNAGLHEPRQPAHPVLHPTWRDSLVAAHPMLHPCSIRLGESCPSPLAELHRNSRQRRVSAPPLLRDSLHKPLFMRMCIKSVSVVNFLPYPTGPGTHTAGCSQSVVSFSADAYQYPQQVTAVTPMCSPKQ